LPTMGVEEMPGHSATIPVYRRSGVEVDDRPCDTIALGWDASLVWQRKSGGGVDGLAALERQLHRRRFGEGNAGVGRVGPYDFLGWRKSAAGGRRRGARRICTSPTVRPAKKDAPRQREDVQQGPKPAEDRGLNVVAAKSSDHGGQGMAIPLDDRPTRRDWFSYRLAAAAVLALFAVLGMNGRVRAFLGTLLRC